MGECVGGEGGGWVNVWGDVWFASMSEYVRMQVCMCVICVFVFELCV